MEQRQGMAALSKSQKKRMKKKEKKAKAKEDETEDAEVVEETTEAANGGAVAVAEGATEEDQADHAAAQACGRPVPPVRQRDRFKTLQTDKVFAKLADFGNGCEANRKITDEIQTRQYRSPEVIIGAHWDDTADVWSAACMFFELITGDFLFDPRTGKDWSRDEDHLALMIELIGSHPPKEWALSGKYSKDFFTPQGKLKHIGKLKYWSLKDVLKQKYSHEEDAAEEISNFLLPMLAWEPSKRHSAAEALKNPWLYKWDEEVERDDDDDEDEEEEDEEEDNAQDTEVEEDDEEVEPKKWVPKLVELAPEPASEPSSVGKASPEQVKEEAPEVTPQKRDEEEGRPVEASIEDVSTDCATEPAESTPPMLVTEPPLAAGGSSVAPEIVQEPCTAAVIPAPEPEVAVPKSKALKKGKGIGSGAPTAPAMATPAVTKEEREAAEETDGVSAAPAPAVPSPEAEAADNAAADDLEDDDEEANGAATSKKKKRNKKKGKK